VVARLRKLAEIEKIPVGGIVLNMAYLNGGRQARRAYPFGRVREPELERRLKSEIIAVIPLESRINSESLYSVLNGRSDTSRAFGQLAERFARIAVVGKTPSMPHILQS
jgi:hypothetical protein